MRRSRETSERYVEACRIEGKALNKAVLSNDISFDYLPFIELCHRHYADEVDLTFGEGPRRTAARDSLQGMLMNFLFPIHLIAEMDGAEGTVEAQHAKGDTPEEQHTFWSAELLAKIGTRHVLSWKTMRNWVAGKAVAKHLYDQSQEGTSRPMLRS